MVEGYSDFDGEGDSSWMGSATEGTDSIRLGYIRELNEDDEGRGRTLTEGSMSIRDSSVGTAGTGMLGVPGGAVAEEEEGSNLIDMGDSPRGGIIGGDARGRPQQQRDISPSPRSNSNMPLSSPKELPALPPNYSQPQQGHPMVRPSTSTQSINLNAKTNKSRSKSNNNSISMQGPFPSPHRTLTGGDSGRYPTSLTPGRDDFFDLIPKLSGRGEADVHRKPVPRGRSPGGNDLGGNVYSEEPQEMLEDK